MAVIAIQCGCAITLHAEDEVTHSAQEENPDRQGRNSIVSMKTMGGRQFWGDVSFFRGWRIQQNVFTGHYRLLDEKDRRHAIGSREFCKESLERAKREHKLQAMSGTAVVLIHGIIRSSKSFHQLKHQLQQVGYLVVVFDYPSTRVDIQRAAGYLHETLESLDGIDTIHLVVHSMGGLVVRAFLAEHEDRRIERMVMMGVPNVGAQLADQLKHRWLYKTVFGPAGQQLGKDPEGWIAQLPIPDFEFAIIAGGRGPKSNGFNPILEGDDDGTVTVESTRLPGATDFILVGCPHSFLMAHEDATAATIRFLQSGAFRSAGAREPIRAPLGK